MKYLFILILLGLCACAHKERIPANANVKILMTCESESGDHIRLLKDPTLEEDYYRFEWQVKGQAAQSFLAIMRYPTATTVGGIETDGGGFLQSSNEAQTVGGDFKVRGGEKREWRSSKNSKGQIFICRTF